MKSYDVVIAGGGIAGLACSEMLSRSGYKVLLIEKNSELCMEASAALQEWFHSGSLYAHFTSPKFLLSKLINIQNILRYYRNFEGMNLAIREDGTLYLHEVENPWFVGEHLTYLFNDVKYIDAINGFSNLSCAANKLYKYFVWKNFVKRRFLARHQNLRKYDWSKENQIHNVPNLAWFQPGDVSALEFDFEHINLNPSDYSIVESYDCPMVTRNIISDLASSFLSNGGDLLLNTTYETYSYDSTSISVSMQNEESVSTSKLVLALGRSLKSHLNLSTEVKTVASPLLVVYPSVCSANFAKVSPFNSQTINHIQHKYSDDISYSLIGNGCFSAVNKSQMRSSADKLYHNASCVFENIESAKVSEVYFGYKTEINGSLNRQYSPRITPIDRNIFGIVPGKFSLAFSLAVNLFKHITNNQPSAKVSYQSDSSILEILSQTRHRSIMCDFLNEDREMKNG